MKPTLSLPVLALTLAACAAAPPAGPPPFEVLGPRLPPAAPTPSHPSFAVWVVGSGPPMILIPGLGCSGEVWNGALARWSSRYQLHVITLAGFAGQPSIGAPLLDRVRDDLLRYIADQRLGRPVVVGHSLGGFLAWWLGATAPDRLGPIVAVEGVPFLSDLFAPGATADSAKPQADMMRRMLAGLSPEQFAAQNRAQLATMITGREQLDRVAAQSARSDPAAVGQAVYELMTTDLRDIVALVRAPALLVLGDALGAQAARAVGERQLAKVRDHRVAVIEGARHFVMLDAPEAFFGAVDAFLEEPAVQAMRR
jgi:N-formylmaleamate deformylase